MTVTSRLRAALLASAELDRPMGQSHDMDRAVQKLQRQVKESGAGEIPEDAQAAAIERFWQYPKLENLRDARLISFGLTIKSASSGMAILEDSGRFLSAIEGIDAWRNEPRYFRRCFHGLVASYFRYDYANVNAQPGGRKNWETLREYLGGRVDSLVDDRLAPDWVQTVQQNPDLWSAEPCAKLGSLSLTGESGYLSQLKQRLLIDDASWFSRELFLARVQAACNSTDAEFVGYLPQLLEAISENDVLHDQGLGMLLDRYANGDDLPLHTGLRDHAVNQWGNPWLTSNSMRWGRVDENTRSVIGDWLKLEFIQSFFTLLAEDGQSDPRRMNFWSRYVGEIDDIKFALGASALSSRAKDFVELRKKTKGLTQVLDGGSPQNNAFIMTMKGFVFVEFSGTANALYVYDSAQTMPFDLSRTVYSAKNRRNSLKSDRRILWLTHQDGNYTWEQIFTSKLWERFGLSPAISQRQSNKPMQSTRMTPQPSVLQPSLEPHVNRQQALEPIPLESSTDESVQLSWLAEPFSERSFTLFCAEMWLDSEDRRPQGGCLWVRNEDTTDAVGMVLKHWGFRLKPSKGWWRNGI